MNKILVMDSSTIISLASNCLLWILDELKSRTGVKFVITPTVKKETIDNAITKKRWMFEALRVKSSMDRGVIELNNSKEIASMCDNLMNLANNIFFRESEAIQLIHKGECELLSLSSILNTNVLAVDEKTTRLLVEDYKALWKLLGRKLHTKIRFHEGNYNEFIKIIGRKYFIRSTEIIASAFQKGILQKKIHAYKNEREIIEGVLWALKFAGCAISDNEIKKYVNSLV